MEGRSINVPSVCQKPWTIDDVANQLGRLFYSRREGIAQPKVRIQAVCTSPEAFDNLAANIGGIDILKFAMGDEGLTITATTQETLDYINEKLNDEKTKAKAT